jgi:hypothetical protein
VKVSLDLKARPIGGELQDVTDKPKPAQTLALYGPGDILGFDPAQVVRTDPRADVYDFEENYFPAVEFSDPDFAWRFTPVAAEGHILRPWLALIVLVAEDRNDTIHGTIRKEYKEGSPTEKNLPPFMEVDPAVLPDLSHGWRWAHVQITAEEGKARDDLEGILRGDPERARCRILCPRRLHAGTRYTAFVVPSFKSGVLTGLGMDVAGAGLSEPAWEHGEKSQNNQELASDDQGTGTIRLPYYYRWEFATSKFAEFEHLVRLLEARQLTGLGLRDIDCGTPGFDVDGVARPDVEPPQDRYLQLEGALQSLDTQYTPWGGDREEAQFSNPEPFQTGLADLLNCPKYTIDIASKAIKQINFYAVPGDTTLRITVRTTVKCACTICYGNGKPIDESGIPGPNKLRHRFTLRKGLVPGQEIPFTISVEPQDEEACQPESDEPDKTCKTEGRFTIPEALEVLPPIYGRWHAGRSTLSPTDQQAWIDTLNLDPRHRTAAGLGAEVIREQQEELMASAWEQLGRIEEANDLFRRSQLGREISTRFHQRMEELPPGDLLRLAAPLHGRLRIRPDNGRPVSVADYLENQTRIPPAAVEPAFRRIIRPKGPVRKRQKSKPGTQREMLFRLAEGRVEPAGPPRRPMGTKSLKSVRADSAFSGRAIHDKAGNGIEDEFKALGPWVPTDEFKAQILQTLGKVTRNPTVISKPAVEEARLTAHIAEMNQALDPAHTILQRLRARVSLRGDLAGQFDDGAAQDRMDEIMAAPSFSEAMYDPLQKRSHELLLPAVDKIPQNTIGLLKVNRRFLEAYMCGLNHEFASELVWRGFPTDQRGSYFRQFWDMSKYVPGESELSDLLAAWLEKKGYDRIGEIPRKEKEALICRYAPNVEDIEEEIGKELEKCLDEELGGLLEVLLHQVCLEEKLKDITKLSDWHDHPLGGNQNRQGEELCLVIRGDLLRRYPNTVIYAVEAELVDDKGSRVPALPEYFSDGARPGEPILPIFWASLPPDLTFLGFPFGPKAVVGDSEHQHGLFFIFEERASETRFGLDTSRDGPLSLENLCWSDFVDGPGDYLEEDRPIDLTVDGRVWNTEHSTSANRAWFTMQMPVRIAVHGEQLLPLPRAKGIRPDAGRQDSKLTARITGKNLGGALDVRFSGSGVLARVQEGGSGTDLPVALDIAWWAQPGPRKLQQVTTLVGTAKGPSEPLFHVVEEDPPLVLQDVEAIPDYAVSLTFNRNPESLMERLTNLGPFSLVSPSNLGTVARHPVGTGPYMFQEEWQPDQEIVLVRNENYWVAKPAIPRLKFEFLDAAGLKTRLFQDEKDEVRAINMCHTQDEELAANAAREGWVVIQLETFYRDHNVFLIHQPEIKGDFVGPGGLHLERATGVDLLWYGCTTQPTTFDPLHMRDTTSLKIASQVLEGLIPCQPGEDGLAVRWGLTEDRLAWTFNLRPDVEFHDGSPLNAVAVVQNLKRHIVR